MPAEGAGGSRFAPRGARGGPSGVAESSAAASPALPSCSPCRIVIGALAGQTCNNEKNL